MQKALSSGIMASFKLKKKPNVIMDMINQSASTKKMIN